MKIEINDKLISWASILEDQALTQAINTSKMPFVYPHVALMPDAHLGMGATVGSVVPTHKAIMPATVGVDIGCGMMAVRTQWNFSQLPKDLKPIREAIEKKIPLSAGNYNKEMDIFALASSAVLNATHGSEQANEIAPNWHLQLGSLGSGNHFIEVSLDENDDVWLFLHSGSRGVGNKLAMKHIKVAKKLCERWFINLPDPDLAYLPEGTIEFTDYLRALRWAQKFALLNREVMMNRVMVVMADFMDEAVEVIEEINCHHNYTEHERHYGQDVWLTRKGAIDASPGKPGLIPGSMGTASYVVEGKGNQFALNSSPHGAGRQYGRNAARKIFSHEDLQKAMVGIEWRDSDSFIDEIPGAYKPIDAVMNDSESLVEIKHTLRQIINVKGN